MKKDITGRVEMGNNDKINKEAFEGQIPRGETSRGISRLFPKVRKQVFKASLMVMGFAPVLWAPAATAPILALMLAGEHGLGTVWYVCYGVGFWLLYALVWFGEFYASRNPKVWSSWGTSPFFRKVGKLVRKTVLVLQDDDIRLVAVWIFLIGFAISVPLYFISADLHLTRVQVYSTHVLQWILIVGWVAICLLFSLVSLNNILMRRNPEIEEDQNAAEND